MTLPRVLVADDEPSVRVSVRRTLARMSLAVTEVEGGSEAIERLAADPFAIVITDLSMPGVDGYAVLAKARECQPRTPVLVLTGRGSLRECVQAMQAGAFNFLTKPFHPDELQEAVQAALAASSATPRQTEMAANQGGRPQAALVGNSDVWQATLDLVARIAPTDATVLLTGESGTGKEVIARLVHGASRRAGSPFVAVNCGALPENLIESELFGHAKGAFTGAATSHAGHFEQAQGGTLFLDEIGELPLGAQTKLLRVLQERLVTPVGSGRPRPVDVRIVAATNRDLGAMVQQRLFREDLFYRLDVLPIALPAMRDRAEDIDALAHHFLEAATRRHGRAVSLSADALALLRLYPWPGNVRELENLIERLVILDRTGVIRPDDLPARMRTGAGLPETAHALAEMWGGTGGIDLEATLSKIENALIDEALRKAQQNRSRAAELLGLRRTTLLDKLRRRI